MRGGIVDVFPPTEDHPVRLEFFGDEIDTITYFQVADQRSTDRTLTEVEAAPCRELLITDGVRRRAAHLVADHPELAELLEKVAAGQAVEGMEALIPALVDRLELLVDVLPSNALVLVNDPELVRIGRRPGPHQPGVPAGRLGRGSHRRQGSHRPGRQCLPAVGRGALARPAAGIGLVVAPASPPPRTPTRSTWMPAWPASRRGTSTCTTPPPGTVTSTASSTRSGSTWPTVGASCSAWKAPARPAGWPSCSASTTSRPASTMTWPTRSK